MNTTSNRALVLALAGMAIGAAFPLAQRAATAPPSRPQGPCDIYAAANDPCVAAHSTTRALYAAYGGPLYRVLRQSDGKSLDIGVVQPVASPVPDAGGYATAADDQAEGQYWVIDGHHYNSGCCFDYGNAEIDSRDDDNGTMETTYYGNATAWYHGNPPGPWIMTDQENNLVGCVNPGSTSKLCADLPNISWRFATAIAKGEPHHWTSMGGDAQRGPLSVMFDGPRIDVTYDPMRKQGAILLGNGGDNSVGSQGTFYEGAMTAAGTFPSDATDQLV